MGRGRALRLVVTHLLTREQYVAKPLTDVFDFFARAENLAHLTPPWLHLVILTPSPIAMAEGACLDYRVRVLGMRLRWTSRIALYQPPREFIDEQIRGPYALWRHRHIFAAQGEGVLVRDEVTYALPCGFLGRIAQKIYVQGALRAVFNYREKMIRELLG